MDTIVKTAMTAAGATEAQAAQFAVYANMLADWNTRMNLTAITDPQEIASKHFADSLLGLRFIPQGASCVDIGSGAGFPGVPLKIMRPDIRLVMLDSLGKRINFLKALCAELGLEGATAIHSRAEEAARIMRDRFDIALTRAVANTATLAEWSAPLLRVGGCAVMYKGSLDNTQAELNAAQNALATLHMTACIEHATADWGERSFIICKKTAPTPKRFPRKPGEASRNPL